MANTKCLFGASSSGGVLTLPSIRSFGSLRVEHIITPRQNEISSLSPEIKDMARTAKAHYSALGAPEVAPHVLEVLRAAVRGKLILPSTNGADTFSKQLAELILYHSLDSESHLPYSRLSRGFEQRFAIHRKLKTLDSQGGDRSAEYVRLLNDKSIELTDLLVAIYARIADMMTVHNPATAHAAETKMPGVFPMHESWDEVKVAWAEPMLRIYCPMADWGGHTTAYREMRDNAIRYLHPEEFAKTQGEVARLMGPLANTTGMLRGILERMADKLNLRVLVTQDIQSVSGVLPGLDERTVAVAIRPFKGVGGLLNKSIKKDIPVGMVHDWSGATVITEDESLMYDIVTFLCEGGISFAAREASVRDFLTLAPKDRANEPDPVTRYQSVHVDTVSRDPNMVPLEMIVRTAAMHKVADEGTAGHDVYKLSPLRNGERGRFMQRLAEISSSF